MLLAGLIASVEHGLNRVLRLDSTALARLAHLTGKVIAVDCRSPALQLFILPSDEGLLLATQWAAEADCTLRAPAASLLHLALSRNKTAILHSPEVALEGDSAVLMDLAAVLQDLELDWEYELSRWIGPVATQLLSGHLRSRSRWYQQGFASLNQNLAEYLSEESRTLVGQREAQARFRELDKAKIDLERLEARFERLSRSLDPSDNA
ncbi:SCP2 sterol-binding domain-containing protein [Pseudomonas fluorescens]|jgi:ubiquinone biosynthesis protein UbiJ|uniref:Ubiquinone biosynthesis accessory factor UbiJ n=1 Tax=Pseudomonas fluorescens TaxID=294 RepID=A0A2N1DXM4_PSEFL|nr:MULTISPECIES: SCP2 sterol-binding domain-containing protein [Pseudomonas]MBD8098298.1 SCP2 sterol-binding domain-containing protein [Pseudomonas fluorescens]MBD8777300.1 SCP2 sterol-binding domain-containing protein [Pseudomonas fluorescens]MBD8779318.1 SCP2 sterol-binding domain-containing protein [Pseudomonas fluorescens]MBD8795848.1 SCP2 sterol-binding domain-containing protein [Pseudomonas fluorescens]PKH15103.1 SCP2 domain-containing protein [Pseudomonas fluorescens]